MVPLIKEGYNVVVARTFSQIYGLAGMRVGYMIAAPETIEKISQFGMGSYGLNQAGIAAAVASYNDEVFSKAFQSKGRRSKTDGIRGSNCERTEGAALPNKLYVC